MQRLAFAAAVLAVATSASAAITQSEAQRLKAAANIVRELESTIPAEYWQKAHCVAVIPDLKKAAFIVGGEYGKGVMSCRSGDSWSAPLFMQLAKGSWGFQAGAQQVDLVLLVMNESGVEKLLKNKVTLGVDASVAAGPLGRQASAATDAQLKAEILSYSRAEGLFAGIDLSGGVLRPDEDANKNVYGSDANPRRILASRDISAPPEAQEFLRALATGPAGNRTTSNRTEQTQSAAAAPAGTSDNDVRARLTQIRQSLDRLLTDARPVGTAGTTADNPSRDGMVTVDRAQLMQLREQIDAALAQVGNRR